VKRINVSAAFYLSIEFQETGYLVERIYKTAFGDAIVAKPDMIIAWPGEHVRGNCRPRKRFTLSGPSA